MPRPNSHVDAQSNIMPEFRVEFELFRPLPGPSHVRHMTITAPEPKITSVEGSFCSSSVWKARRSAFPSVKRCASTLINHAHLLCEAVDRGSSFDELHLTVLTSVESLVLRGIASGCDVSFRHTYIQVVPRKQPTVHIKSVWCGF